MDLDNSFWIRKITPNFCYLTTLTFGFSHYLSLLAGDLNIDELKTGGSDSSNHLSDVKDVFNLKNLVKKPTYFKSQDGTLIDLMLTNRPRSFLKSQNFEIGLSDCRKLVVSILRASFKKLPKKIITYRHLNCLKQNHFLRDLDSRLLQGQLYRNCDES